MVINQSSYSVWGILFAVLFICIWHFPQDVTNDEFPEVRIEVLPLRKIFYLIKQLRCVVETLEFRLILFHWA